MRIFVCFVACFFSILTAMGRVTLTGSVADAAGNGLAFANVAVIKDSVMIGGTAADADGHFTVTVDRDLPVTLKATYLGISQQIPQLGSRRG